MQQRRIYLLLPTILVALASTAQAEDLDSLFADEPAAAATPAAGSAPAKPVSESTPPAGIDTLVLPEQTPQPVARKPSGRVIEEIVVTAQKTEQTLQEVPVAVSVVGGQTLRDSGVFGAEGIENLVPNVELDSDAQAPTIGVRGFSTDSYNVGLEPSVGIIVDDVPIGRTEFIPDGLYDIQRVEVLRGPQGTLFGKNTIAGVLIFGTGEPEPETSGSMLATLGEHDEQRVEMAASVPLTDNLLSRVAGLFWKTGGEVENSFLDRRELAFDQYAARLKLSYDLGDRMQLRLGGQFADIKTDYAAWQLYDVDSDALAYAQSKGPSTEDNPLDQHTSFDLPGFVDHTTDLLHISGDYDLSENHMLTGILGHANMDNRIAMDFDVSAADLARVYVHHTYSQESLELRSSGQFELFGYGAEYVGGVFGFQSDMFISVDVAVGEDIVGFGLTPAGAEALGGPGLSPLTPILVGLPVPPADLMDGIFQVFNQDTQSIAAFGQVTWFLSDKLGLITGLRLGQDNKDAVLSITSRGLGITALVVGANDPPDTDFSEPLRRRESEVSPKLGLRYEFHDEFSVYGSWTRGFKGGGFNAISFNSENLEFEPEQGDSFELGAKSRLFDGSMALNTTLYHTEVSNMQVVNFNGVSFDVFNAAESVLEGFEADLTWLTPWEWLSVNAALAISRAEYKSYPEGPQTAEQAADCNSDLGEDCVQDLSGKTLPKAPNFTASVSPVVSLPINAWLGLQIGADISFRGDQYLTLDLDPHSYQKEQTLIGARISLGDQDDSWSATLRGSNLTDEKALSFVADHNLYANSYFSTQIPGRSLSLSLNVQW